MMKTDNTINFPEIIKNLDTILERGLSKGPGPIDGQVCIEQAICLAMEMNTELITIGYNEDTTVSDSPTCVTREIRDFKVKLNDCDWSSPEARAKGLRDLGIAQIGSLGVVKGSEFLELLTKKFAKILIPALLRDSYPENSLILELALAYENTEVASQHFNIFAAIKNSGLQDVFGVNEIFNYLDSRQVSKILQHLPTFVWPKIGDKYLLLVAEIALDVLKELKSPGCAFI